MFSHIDLLTLLFAPVIAYLVAAVVFAALQGKSQPDMMSGTSAPLHYTDGHSK